MKWMLPSIVLLVVAASSCSRDTGGSENLTPFEGDAAVDADVTSPDGGVDAVADDAGQGASDASPDASTDSGADLVADLGADASEPSVPFQSGVEVETSHGTVRGTEEDGLRVFRGIPFAAPPVGDLRLQPTEPAEPWSDPLDAAEFGPACIQQSVSGFSEPTSEDCLTLNVWAHTDDVERPVMVWIYGGGFLTGSGSLPYYDGVQFAENADVVIVTFNYRLGPLGYLATPELKADSSDGSTGNYGLLDQIEALRWVKENAPAFGGDPDNITVFGESAGAFSICSLIGSELADDLFDKAIIQSGGCNAAAGLDQPAGGLPSAYDSGATMVEQLGCDAAADQVACLRGLPAEDFVLDASSLLSGLLTAPISLGPTLDGVVLDQLPYERIASGEAPPRPMIAGSNGNEGALFTGTDVVFSRFDLRAKFEEVVDEPTADELMDVYDAFTFPIPKDAWNAFVGEVLFNCNSYHAARAHAGRARYYYLDIAPLVLSTPQGPLHATDIFYVFGTFSSAGIIPSLRDLEVRDFFQQAWGTFAHSDAPDVDEPAWPETTSDGGEFMEIDFGRSVETDFRGGRCADLRRLGLLP